MVTIELASFHFNPFQTREKEGRIPYHPALSHCHLSRPHARLNRQNPPPYHLIPKHTQLCLHFCEIRCPMLNCSGYILDETDRGFIV
jgi:hypothetical protein